LIAAVAVGPKEIETVPVDPVMAVLNVTPDDEE
jgi:hypothetical protein